MSDCWRQAEAEKLAVLFIFLSPVTPRERTISNSRKPRWGKVVSQAMQFAENDLKQADESRL
jgi:hypothetical protein